MNVVSMKTKVLIFKILLYGSLFCGSGPCLVALDSGFVGNPQKKRGGFWLDTGVFFSLCFVMLAFVVVAWYFMSFPGILKKISLLDNVVFAIILAFWIPYAFGAGVMVLGGTIFYAIFVFMACQLVCRLEILPP